MWDCEMSVYISIDLTVIIEMINWGNIYETAVESVWLGVFRIDPIYSRLSLATRWEAALYREQPPFSTDAPLFDSFFRFSHI